MKLLHALAFAAFAFLMVPAGTFAQKPGVGCIDKSVRLQADEIKKFYTEQGLTVMRDAMLNMSSMEPFPVMTQLQRGQMYMIIYVGHPAVHRMSLEVFDGSDQKLTELITGRGKAQPNYIIYNMVPERTDTYLFTLMQRLKNEDMCGSLCILKLNPDKRVTEIKPYQY